MTGRIEAEFGVRTRIGGRSPIPSDDRRRESRRPGWRPLAVRQVRHGDSQGMPCSLEQNEPHPAETPAGRLSLGQPRAPRSPVGSASSATTAGHPQ